MRKKIFDWSISRRNLLAGMLAGVFSFFGRESAEAASTITASLQSIKEPTKASLSVRSNFSAKAYIEYGYSAGAYTGKTSVAQLKAGASKIYTISNLKPGAKVFYRLRYSAIGKSTYLSKPSSSFTLPTSFTKSVFAVQADPHMDENSSADVYNGTLSQIVNSSPAFLVDLGDIFMVDKLQDKSETNIRARYQLMKGYYQKLQGIPLKIVLGNHDGELGYSNFNTKKYRAEYFPEQTSDVTYFSFEGPDQLHVCLDPFTYTTENPKADGWQWTLGRTQYDWLKQTLESSSARHKFIYIHHLLVGDAQSRGGVEIAKRNEWGGLNTDGSQGFATKRSGWSKPVHDLLVENKVSFVFKGHDHVYVKQELDGIIYQTLPQPSHPGDKLSVEQYGYVSGKAVGGSGFLRVTTSGATAKVEFVKFDGSIADSYEKVVA
jgi:hypothetical protein